MPRYFARVAACALTLTSLGTAGAQPTRRSCATPQGVSLDSLRAAVRRLHPDALAPANRRAFVVIGLVFNSSCELTHHAVGRRPADSLSAASTLARLFPDVAGTRYPVSGIAEAEGHGPRGPGSPWIVWGVEPARSVGR